MSPANDTLLYDLMWIAAPCLVLFWGMSRLFRAEAEARGIQDETARTKRLNLIGWANHVLLAGFIVTLMGRNHEVFVFAAKSLSREDVVAILPAVILVAAFATIWTVRPGPQSLSWRYAKVFIVMVATVLAIAMSPALVKSTGAPCWGVNVALFVETLLGLRWLVGPLPDNQPVIVPAGPLSAQVVSLLRKGQKIQAIAFYRRQTGCGLAEAKQEVESIGIAADTAQGDAR
jgi:hypothetical protein